MAVARVAQPDGLVVRVQILDDEIAALPDPKRVRRRIVGELDEVIVHRLKRCAWTEMLVICGSTGNWYSDLHWVHYPR